MFRTHRRFAALIAATFISVVSLSACGGNDSDSGRTRNAISPTATCAEGGECTVGDVGPGGGVVFFDAGSDLEWGRYLEVAPENWAQDLNDVSQGWKKLPLAGDVSRGADPFGQFNEFHTWLMKGPIPRFNPANNGNGIGKKEWEKVKDYRCGNCITDTIAEYNLGKVSDWYLPNSNEMQTLIKSKQRNLTGTTYWTSTNYPSSSPTQSPQMIQWRRDNTKSTDWGYQAFFQHAFYAFLAIRAFSATAEEVVPEPVVEEPTETTEQVTETTSANQTSSFSQTGTLQAPTNLEVTFNDDNMDVTFDLQKDGLEPEGHFILMKWTGGENGIHLKGNVTKGSTWVPHWERGKPVEVSVRSYTNATRPSQIAETNQIRVEIPAKKIVEQPEPPSDEEIVNTVGNLNTPLLNLPPEEVTGDIDPENIVNTINSQLPETEIKKIEILTNNSKVEDEEKFVEISQTEKTPYVIPPEATELTIRVTGTEGEVIEQTKLIVRIADNGLEIAPEVPASAPATTVAPGTSETKSTSTTVKPDPESETETSSTTESERVDTTAVPEVASDSSDLSTDSDSSGTNPIVWLLIAIIALLLAGFAAQRLKKTKN